MHKLIIIIMDTIARRQKLHKINLSLRRRREVAVTNVWLLMQPLKITSCR